MSDEQHPSGLAERVRGLAQAFAKSDLLRVRVERSHESIELGRYRLPADRRPAAPAELESVAMPASLEIVRADLVGIFHLSRPQPSVGERLEADRELASIEALGIRNPVRSRGAARIVAIRAVDGDPVEYGQPLFELDRG
ncbi:MAG: acetyl-CoA carboxylase biotin carboxyl carrier protein [Vulcanimicrobiaceae bacterium]